MWKIRTWRKRVIIPATFLSWIGLSTSACYCFRCSRSRWEVFDCICGSLESAHQKSQDSLLQFKIKDIAEEPEEPFQLPTVKFSLDTLKNVFLCSSHVSSFLQKMLKPSAFSALQHRTNSKISTKTSLKHPPWTTQPRSPNRGSTLEGGCVLQRVKRVAWITVAGRKKGKHMWSEDATYMGENLRPPIDLHELTV